MNKNTPQPNVKYGNLISAIKSAADLPIDEENKLLALGKEAWLKRGELFINEGEVPRKFAFVNKGLFRYYYVDQKGNEFTKGFFAENTFLSSYSAMVLSGQSHFSIEALEDSEIVVFNFNQWKELLSQHICWNQLLISVLEKAFIKKEKREREFLLFDAEKRYTLFLQEQPDLDRRIKQNMIASYLGITNVALSRVRKKMGLVNLG